MAKKPTLKITGKTTDGKDVVSGVFKLYDTIGMPLSLVIELLNENNKAIDWLDFKECAIKSGWKNKTIKSRIEEALIDTYGKIYSSEILKRLAL